ncbi:hypothetical protein ANN_21370 [Periplaneta americana]|uniref:Uncharacterized protein n=1 Tax=Periplaneta americana TaxID=6978 RepID=A0ABQ8SF35_PERAM|nr:hypothetical protein ANN_21370 [Periplaneta americana]
MRSAQAATSEVERHLVELQPGERLTAAACPDPCDVGLPPRGATWTLTSDKNIYKMTHNLTMTNIAYTLKQHKHISNLHRLITSRRRFAEYSGFEQETQLVPRPVLSINIIISSSNITVIIIFIKCRMVKIPIFISKICILNPKCVSGSVGNKVRDKLEQVLLRNVRLKDLRTASDILAGKNTDLQCNIPVQLVSKLKYAPVTSVDVERSFSAYKLC